MGDLGVTPPFAELPKMAFFSKSKSVGFFQFQNRISSFGSSRSMSARPGHHNPDRRDQERGEDIRAAARTLARLLRTETRHDGRRGGSLRPQQMGRRPRNGPRRFHGPPPRNPQRTPEWRPRPPFAFSSPRWRTNRQRYPRGKARGIGEPACCPGEALLWQRSKNPDSTSRCR